MKSDPPRPDQGVIPLLLMMSAVVFIGTITAWIGKGHIDWREFSLLGLMISFSIRLGRRQLARIRAFNASPAAHDPLPRSRVWLGRIVLILLVTFIVLFWLMGYVVPLRPPEQLRILAAYPSPILTRVAAGNAITPRMQRHPELYQFVSVRLNEETEALCFVWIECATRKRCNPESAIQHHEIIEKDGMPFRVTISQPQWLQECGDNNTVLIGEGADFLARLPTLK